MVWNIKEDILFGKKNEKKVISWFNKNENQDDWFKAYKLAFKKVDFKNSKIIGELKTRTCSSTYYPDTMFGYNKMKYLKEKRQLKENETRQFVFYFLFTNGLYKWVYEEGKENQYRIDEFIHQEKGPMPYCYVLKEYLELVTTEINSNTPPAKDEADYLVK